MNSSQRRSVMFGEKPVIEMDIDPFVSNLDTPADLKVPTTFCVSKFPSQHSSPTTTFTTLIHKGDDEKKENNASEVEEPVAKRKC